MELQQKLSPIMSKLEKSIENTYSLLEKCGLDDDLFILEKLLYTDEEQEIKQLSNNNNNNNNYFNNPNLQSN